MENEKLENQNIDEVIENEIKNIETGEIEFEVPKKKRGRPKGSKNKKVEETENKDIDLENTFNFPLSMVINLFLNRLELTELNEFEANTINQSFNIVLAKYINEIKFKEEINFAIILLITLSSRYFEYKEKKKIDNKNNNAKES